MAKERIKDFRALAQELNHTPSPAPERIEFIGREAETEQMKKFIADKSKFFLEISGVPMIGKTLLSRHFCQENKLETVRVSLKRGNSVGTEMKNALREVCESREKKILVFENFEYALSWSIERDKLHKITVKGFSDFADLAVREKVKIILESRFRADFDASNLSFLPIHRRCL